MRLILKKTHINLSIEGYDKSNICWHFSDFRQFARFLVEFSLAFFFTFSVLLNRRYVDEQQSKFALTKKRKDIHVVFPQYLETRNV